MYRQLGSVFSQQFFRNLKKNSIKTSKNRLYHSNNSIYGFKSQEKSIYNVPEQHLRTRNEYSNFYRLVQAYRKHAHRRANIDPITCSSVEHVAELDPDRYSLKSSDFLVFTGVLNTKKHEGTLEEALEILEDTYCRHIGAEFAYLETLEEREWFAEHFEKSKDEVIDENTKRTIAELMLKSQNFDNFLARKFVSLKRYGGEGAESMMAFFNELFHLAAAKTTLENIILCTPHRGRLNLLTGLLNVSPEKIFHKLLGQSEFTDDVQASGDVISHFISSTTLNFSGRKLYVSMLYNPSHLEAVNPVSMGKTRAMMQEVQDGGYSTLENARWSDKVLNVQVHGDAAYPGQGINQESLALSAVPHFEIGGTLHMVVNNQLGFTTPASRGRSSRYCTDLAKFIAAPVLHVNGDDPEAVVRATRVAFDYQRKFRKDVFVDINCFRRWGHNELDDPTMTNPTIYKKITNRKSIPDKYQEILEASGIFSTAEKNTTIKHHTELLSKALKKANTYIPNPSYFTDRWSGFQQAQSNLTRWDSGVDLSLLKFVIRKSVDLKPNLDVHPNVMKNHILTRLKKLEAGSDDLDWSTAEAAAFGSLLYQGYNVRISGQDVGRGTFSQRHAMLVDQLSGELHIPLNSMAEGQTGRLEIANSILSEEAVLGFEYGVSITSPMTLAIWEAQFGDFFNGAQIIIDTFITSGETKWMLNSGLIMLLPHGYDGAGPEHSSCRLERFLQLSDSKENSPDDDNVNIQIVNPTTPAQYFHLLRRQMIRNFKKPLIVAAPKILLRHASATSSLHKMGPQTSFENVIGDDFVDSEKVQKVILVSGKHYYALKKHRDDSKLDNIAIIRVESLCPFPVYELTEELNKYRQAKSFIWSQEEPRNMGAWSFIKARFENLCGRQLKYCGRDVLSTPAVGIGHIHQVEAREVVIKPFFTD